MKVLYALPTTIDWVVRGLIMTLPRSLAPKPKTYGCVVEFDPKINKITRIFQDPKGEDIAHLFGVAVNNGKLYFGSFHNKFIGVYDLN